MKKRRLLSHSAYRPLRPSPKPGENRASDSFLLRHHSSEDLKRKRLPHNANQKRQYRGYKDESAELKNEYPSLKSLFDVQKIINLQALEPLQLYDSDDTISDSLTSKSSGLLELNLGLQSTHQIELEPNLSAELFPTNLGFHRTNSELERSETDSLNDTKPDMADEEVALVPENMSQDDTTEDPPEVVEDVPESSAIEEDIAEDLEEEEEDIFTNEETEEILADTQEGEEEIAREVFEARPYLDHALSSTMANGVEMEPGHRADSLMSQLPITDEGMMDKINATAERCQGIKMETIELQQQIAELNKKEDLSEEDKMAVDTKSKQLMLKMSELEDMTREIARMVGIEDARSEDIAKFFGMFPSSPHHRDEAEELLDEPISTFKEEILGKESTTEIGSHGGPELSDHFEDQVPEFPEERLPKVIVCGHVEDNIPTIVIADSQRKPRDMQHVKNMAGRLTEMLNMQEKLAQENANLEGNKYKLQEALLERDNVVDHLQRKVCGLQLEMQLLMKENDKLNRRFEELNERQSRPGCCSHQGDSSRDIDKPREFSPISPRHKELCKCCPVARSTTPQSLCASPRGPSSAGKNSPRLSGGGSPGIQILSNPNQSMCCRNLAVSPRSVPAESTNPGACPAEIADKLENYGANTKKLEEDIGCMESEVCNIKMQLATLQRQRQLLEQQKKLLKCTGPCAPCPCPSPQDPSPIHQSLNPSVASPYEGQLLSKISQGIASSCSGICIDQPPGTSNCPQQQLRDLREQYARLQEDYKNKLCEVSCLRTDTEKIKHEVRDARDAKERAENRMIDLQERLKKFESDRSKFGGSREQMIEDKHRLMVAEQRHKEALEELEELRLSNQEYLLQLEDYRNKYLKAQETVEEQTRQLDMMEIDNARMNENVTLEIGRVKNQFQEKLAELAPLPEILKQSQLKLQESQQMRLMAERNSEELDRELLGAKDKIGNLSSQLDMLRSENAILKGEKGSGSDRLDDLENKISELRNENERLKNAVSRFEERESEYEDKLEQKLHEIVQLSSENELVRQDAARQVARTKERCETSRRTMQEQIADMEKQLAQCRAVARAAQKDRDEIRQKMQGQINRLGESFEQAQGRIRTLQGHVNYLKTSYSNVFSIPANESGPTPSFPTPPENTSSSPYDACDCNS